MPSYLTTPGYTGRCKIAGCKKQGTTRYGGQCLEHWTVEDLAKKLAAAKRKASK